MVTSPAGRSASVSSCNVAGPGSEAAIARNVVMGLLSRLLNAVRSIVLMARAAANRHGRSSGALCTTRVHTDWRSTMDLGLAGAAVIVSGGTTGMGRAAADCFAADGARVAVLARSQTDLDATAEALTALGSPDAIGIAVDLFDRPATGAAVTEIGERWGHV